MCPARDLAARLKPIGRRAVDKVVQPYVDQAVDRMTMVALAPGAALPRHFSVLHEALHDGRTIALAGVPRGAGTVLSAGANGSWYFEWVEEIYGRVTRHIGVEAYSPRPATLPSNVEWVSADVAAPGGVAQVVPQTVELVFSGQNIEHLWPQQMVAFLVEANRVLRQDGLLVVDSPNRALTAAYRWSMGEHTIELTPGEASLLFADAGFEVERMKGVWLRRDHDGLVDLEPDPLAGGSRGLVRRFALAEAAPDDSFIWWAEARRISDPDVAKLDARVHALFGQHWLERVSRVQPVDAAEKAGTVVVEKGRSSCAFGGPSMPLLPGSFVASCEVGWRDCDEPDRPVARMEVTVDGTVLGVSDVYPEDESQGWTTVECPFVIERTQFGVSVRLVSTGRAGLSVPLSLSLSPDPWSPRPQANVERVGKLKA